MIPRLRYFATLILMSVFVCGPARSADGLYFVAGTVVDAGTNSPLPHAYVRIYGLDSDRAVFGFITGNDGRFSFQVPEGSWRLMAGTRDDQQSYGLRDPANDFGSAVIVGPDKDTSALVFHFYRPVVITGHVVDDAGEPAARALVQLVRQTVSAGRRSASVLSWQWTDDLGEYRFDHIAGGTTYFLAVSGQPWYNDRTRANSSRTASDNEAAAYAPSYYPGVSDPGKASPLAPRPGQEIRADFRLTTVANSAINVNYDAPPGLRGTAVLTNEGIAGTTAIQQTQQLNVITVPRSSDGGRKQLPSLLSLKSVPPGHYNLLITGTAGSDGFGIRTPIDVNGSDISLDLKLTPLMKVEGTVHFPSGITPKNPVMLAIRDVAGGAVHSVPARSDGGFSFPNAMAGKYNILIGGNNGFFITKLDTQGGSVANGILEVPEATPVNLSVSVSNQTGDVKGIVFDGDRPAEGMLVVMISSPGDTVQVVGEERFRGYQTESDGSFEFRTVPAGRHRIFAVDNTGLEYATAEGVAPWLPGAKEVEVHVGATTETRIPLALASKR